MFNHLQFNIDYMTNNVISPSCSPSLENRTILVTCRIKSRTDNPPRIKVQKTSSFHVILSQRKIIIFSETSTFISLVLVLRTQLPLLPLVLSFLCPLPVGIVPPRTKSPTDESHSSSAGVSRRNGRVPNGISRVCQPKLHVNNFQMSI